MRWNHIGPRDSQEIKASSSSVPEVNSSSAATLFVPMLVGVQDIAKYLLPFVCYCVFALIQKADGLLLNGEVAMSIEVSPVLSRKNFEKEIHLRILFSLILIDV